MTAAKSIRTRVSHALCAALALVAILTLADEADASEVLRANLVVTGSFHTCAMRTVGGITCWGRNQTGALGYGNTRDRSSPSISPIRFPGSILPVKLFAGYDGTCVIDEDRAARCWGVNDSGQLGTGDQQARLAPPATAINFAGTDVDQIAAGQKFSCAVLIDGGLSCWGSNTYGRLGYGHTTDVLVPGAHRVDLGPGRTALKVSLGVASACALLDNRSVKCWGYNPRGELGYGDAIDRHAPPSAPVDLGAGRQANDIAVGAHSACALLDGGDIKCWGDNGQGQLGYGDYVTRLRPPSTTLTLGAAAKQLLVGTFIGCAVLITDRVKCWGLNDYGQSGYGDATPRPAPTNEVLSFDPPEVPSLSLDNHHVCGRYADATVRCWGRNSWGNLGYGDTSSRSGPPSSLPALLAEPSPSCPDVQVVGVRGSRSSDTQPRTRRSIRLQDRVSWRRMTGCGRRGRDR